MTTKQNNQQESNRQANQKSPMDRKAAREADIKKSIADRNSQRSLSELADVMKQASEKDQDKNLDPAEIRKLMRDTIENTINAHKGGDTKEIKKANQAMFGIQRQVRLLNKGEDERSDKAIELYEEVVDEIKKGNKFLDKMRLDKLREKGMGKLADVKDALISGLGPVFKLGMNTFKMGKEINNYLTQQRSLNKDQLKAIESANAVIADEKKAETKTIEPKEKPAHSEKKVERVERNKSDGPMVSAMRSIEKSTIEQTGMLEKLVDVVSKIDLSKHEETKKEPSRKPGKNPSGSRRQQMRESAKNQAELINSAISESSKAQVEVLTKIYDVLSIDNKQDTGKDESVIIAAISEKLDGLKTANESLGVLVNEQIESNRIAKEARMDNNKDQLRKSNNKKGSKLGIIDNSKGVEGKTSGGGIMSILGDIVGEIIGVRLAKGGGLLGGIKNGVKSVVSKLVFMLNPKNWLSMAGDLFKTTKSLMYSLVDSIKGSKFIKMMTSVIEPIKNWGSKFIDILKSPMKFLGGIMDSFGSSFGKIGEVVGGVFGKVKGWIGSAWNVVSKFGESIGSLFGSLGKWFETFTGAFSGGGKIAKMVTKGLSLGKTIPIIGQVLTVVMGIWDFASGFGDAAKILGKAEGETVTLWDRFSAGFGKLLGSFAGIVDMVTGLFGFDTDYEKTVTEKVSKFLASIPDFIGGLFDKVKTAIANVADLSSKNFFGSIKLALLYYAKAFISAMPFGGKISEMLGLDKAIADTEKENGLKSTSVDPKAPVTAVPVKPDDKVPTSAIKPTAVAPEVKPSDTKNLVNNFSDVTTKNQDKIDSLKKPDGSDKSVAVAKVDNSTTNNVTQINTQPISTRNFDDSWSVGLKSAWA